MYNNIHRKKDNFWQKAVYLFKHSNCSHPSLEVASISDFVTERMAVIHSLKCTLPFSFVLPLASCCCQSLSFVVTCCHLLSLLVTRSTILGHSLSFVVPLVVTLCTTRLSFYKRSRFSLRKFCRSSIYVITIVKFSNRPIQNLFNFPNRTSMDSCKVLWWKEIWWPALPFLI